MKKEKDKGSRALKRKGGKSSKGIKMEMLTKRKRGREQRRQKEVMYEEIIRKVGLRRNYGTKYRHE